MSIDTTPPQSGPPQSGPVQPGPARLRGWVKAVFILSLVVNFLVIGMVSGAVIGHRRNLPPPPVMERENAGDAFTLGPLSGAFTREDRAAMRRAAEGRGTDFPAMSAAIRGDFAQLEAALAGESFDEAAVRAVLAEMRARTLKRMDLGEEAMLARLRAMSTEERQAFIGRLRKGLERFERHLDDGPRRPGEKPGEKDDD